MIYFCFSSVHFEYFYDVLAAFAVVRLISELTNQQINENSTEFNEISGKKIKLMKIMVVRRKNSLLVKVMQDVDNNWNLVGKFNY